MQRVASGQVLIPRHMGRWGWKRVLDEASDKNFSYAALYKVFQFPEYFLDPTESTRVQKLKTESPSLQIICQIHGTTAIPTWVFWILSSCFPPPSKPGMLACFGVWMVGSTTAASTATGRDSTVALLAGRHVSRLRHLWFSAMRSSHRGEEPFSSLLCLQTRGPGARLPLPHHPCTTYPVVSTSQCCKSGFLSKSPWCYPSSGVLYSHVSYGNGLLMGVSTCSLCPHL